MNSSQGLVLVCLLMVGRTCNSSSNVLILGGTVKKWNQYLDDTFATNKCGNI